MKHRVSRRQFLRGMGGIAGSLAFAAAGGKLAAVDLGAEAQGIAKEPDEDVALPKSGVVHVHNAQATHWDFANGWYGDAVVQRQVSRMVYRGLLKLTGTASAPEAWASLLPEYQPGVKIAIKVNLNNSSCNDEDNAIDALIQPVRALIGSMVGAGIRQRDIWVYDAIRAMPGRFYKRRWYTGARFYDSSGCADSTATFNHIDPSLRVNFTNPALKKARWLTDLLFKAKYVINMPIMKIHGWAPVTLGFKNHFGSLNDLGGAYPDNPHPYINPRDGLYSATSNPLVDINSNPNIAGKTVLTVGDGLYGAPGVNDTPVPWSTFGNKAPNSLLFSRDPVAIDCVMTDLLRKEFGVNNAAYDYLQLAEQSGLGTFERGDPWGGGYARIRYVRFEQL